ncbi:NAD(P)H-binding protein [Streptomyces virginiae]|uniref:NAD(P)H-binding protein n=1 Tax=Streptomyces virginiae TaxID=1961 RepID=UPI0037B2494D
MSGVRPQGHTHAATRHFASPLILSAFSPCVVTEALGRGHHVTAFRRDATRIDEDRKNVVWQRVAVLDTDAIAAVIPGLDVLISGFQPGNVRPASIRAGSGSAAISPYSTRTGAAASRWPDGGAGGVGGGGP